MRRLALLLLAAALVAGCTSAPNPAPTPPPAAGGAPAGPAPTADFTVSPAQGGPDTTFAFDGSPSTGDGLSYNWNFGDGQTGTGKQVTHAYTGAPTDAVYGVALTVTDGDGRSALTVKPALLGSGSNAPPPAQMTLSSTWVGAGQTVNATAGGSGLTYLWGLAFDGASPPGDMMRNNMPDMSAMSGAMTEADYHPAPNGFDSPPVEPGQTYSVTLQEPGLYLFHCHPHPWMVGAILVEPGAVAGTRDFAMDQAKWFLPLSTTVPPGTTLTFHNEDQVWHTVSLTGHFPLAGLQPGGATHAFTLPQPGVYELGVVVRDAKGALNATSQFVQVTAQAPATSLHENWSGSIQVAVPNGTAQQNLTLPFPGTATFAFNWTEGGAPVALPTTTAQLDVYAANGTTPAGPSLLTVTSAPVTKHLPAGNYSLVVTASGGAAVDYAIVLDATLEPQASFATNPAMGGG